jgi:3-methyladenine DNA glycosylase AlkC
MSEIPVEVRQQLSQGKLESKNLVEWLAVDRFALLDCLCQDKILNLSLAEREELRDKFGNLSALKQSKAIAAVLTTRVRVGDSTWKALAQHASDVVREWSALVVGHAEFPFPKKLAWIKPHADDDNSGLRELAWIALRDDVVRAPESCMQALVPWTGSRRERLRRFASEITRPCGVWAPHVPLLKEQPELGLPILEPLRHDEAKYVRDSVGNWLNDASKTSPDWVQEITQRWLRAENNPHSAYIVRRALRSIR